MVNRYWLLPLLLLGLGGCTQNTPRPSALAGQASIAPELKSMVACLNDNDSLSPAQIRQLEQRLAAADDADKRFHLACLLGRASASDAELARAQSLLESMKSEPSLNTEHQQLIAFYQRYLLLTQQLRQQRRETREYRRKIEQLKGLEEELEPDSVRQEALQ